MSSLRVCEYPICWHNKLLFVYFFSAFLLFVLDQGKITMADSKDFKALAHQELDLPLSEALAEKTQQYQDVIPEEVLDLLEEAVETYVVLEPTLPNNLRRNAKKEIEFFLTLYKEKIKKYFHIQNPQPPQKIRRLLACFGTEGK